jgi:hypothetical protein
MHSDVLESERFPEVVFLPKRLSDYRGDARQGKVTIHGRIQIHGSEHELAIPAEATFDDSRVQLRSRFLLPYVKWGMKDVSTFVLRVGKTVEVSVEATGTLDRPLAASQ